MLNTASMWLIVAAAAAGGCVEVVEPGAGSSVDADAGDFPTDEIWSGGGGGVDGSTGPGGAANFAPGAPEVSLTPAEPTTADELEVVIDLDAIDPDGGPEAVTYRYTWTRDGLATPHTSASIPPEVTARGELWAVAVRAFDGRDEGPPAEIEVEVGNSPPSLEDVHIDPSVAGPSSVLKCVADDRHDPDGDDVSVTYQWYIDDNPVPDGTASAISPPLDVGVRYRCAATPFDGAATGKVAYSQEVIPANPLSEDALISFQPKALDLGTVVPGQTSSRELTIANIGDGDLVLEQVFVTGDEGFGYEGEMPLTVPPGELETVTVTFATDSAGLHKGNLEFLTNALNQDSAEVAMLGIGASPCLQALPTKLDFGGAYVASKHELSLELRSCGALPVVVDSIALVAPNDTPFILDMAPGPGPLPWTLQPLESAFVDVRFEPFQSSPLDEDGAPIPETAAISIAPAGLTTLLNVNVSGFGSAQGCPVPIIDVEEGNFVSPGTLLHLHAGKSIAPGGVPPIVSWAVTPPPGAPAGMILPAADVHSVTYQVDTDVLGEYVFQLKVFDEVDGTIIPGCGTALWSVTSKDAIPLIVELTWDTPGDPDQGDSGPGAGADLDLHMHNGQGDGEDYDGDGEPDTWFDLHNDLYWFDTSPEWGEVGDAHDPWLVIEDPDGAGPERIEFHDPQKFADYTIGVHCWSGFEYGPSIATVKIFHFETLVKTLTDVVLQTGDLWEVGTLGWPKAELVESVAPAGGPLITPGYPNIFQ